MLSRIKIKNFKSIENMDLYFEDFNNIIGNNGAGKTNILQAICCLFQSNNISRNVKDYLKIGTNNLYIEGYFFDQEIEKKITYSYDLENDKKLITLNGKKVTKKILNENILKISYFSPISMNLFYFSPKNRRDFIDNLLEHLYDEYGILLKKYENILKNRNKILQNIYLGSSKKEEITFWNDSFVNVSLSIYKYRLEFNDFINSNISEFYNIFGNKINKIEYKYLTKVNISDIKNSIIDYLEKNIDRDIILGKTHIGPHIDDFEIVIDNKNIIDYASRGEIKSVLINLKLLEIQYIKKISGKLPIILIDDFISEIDENHQKILIDKLNNLQIIFTSIIPYNSQKNNLIII